MTRRIYAAIIGGLTGIALTLTANADGYSDHRGGDWSHRDWDGSLSFERIATVPNYVNNPDAGETTVSEIVAATKTGEMLVYTDSPLNQIGFVDIRKAHTPVHAGTVALSGEPTAVAVLGNQWALVGVNTSNGSYTNPSGHLAVVDVWTRQIAATLDLGGQPDSVSISPDGRYAAIAIENERNEDVTVDGEEGGLPQLPAGFLAIVDIAGDPANWTVRAVDMTGLSVYAPEDPEPEFVDINGHNEAVVTMQENNHIAIVDLKTGSIKAHFDAGTVDLEEVDANEDGIIALEDSLSGVPREPDAVAWVPVGDGDRDYGRYGRHGHERYAIATANEGDLFGGSRGFTLFGYDGRVKYDSGSTYEAIAVRHGHYPEDRSENKGSEPESIEYGEYFGRDYLFVGSERGSFVAVYTLRSGKPEFSQLLPAPLGPEGVLAIPARGLLVVSGEEDDPSFGVRSSIMIYALERGRPSYPQILSADGADGKPISWSALSGMTAAPDGHDKLLAVWDSYYSESRILTIDASSKPARIVEAVTIAGGSGNYDPEGIDVAPDGTYWIASEGNADRSNLLIQTDMQGQVIAEVGLPAEIEACRAATANTGTRNSGFEGVAVLPRSGWSWRKSYVLLVAQQRGWDYTTPECEALDDDLDDVDPGEPGHTRIWIYDPKSGEWNHIAYELEALPPNTSWVGLSEITKVPGGFIVLERDNRTGDFAQLKTLVYFKAWDALDGIVSKSDTRTYDMLPDLDATSGWITDKPEGVAVTRDGKTFVVTDNDGVEDWSGETWFLRLGDWWGLFE